MFFYWILIYISLRSMQAQSLIFLMHNILLWGKEKEYSQIPMCIFLIWIFLALDFPCDCMCMCCRRLVLQLHRYAVPPFMSHSTFVTSQLEQHDLELFKAACTFCIKKYEKERKKSKETKGYLITYVSST